MTTLEDIYFGNINPSCHAPYSVGAVRCDRSRARDATPPLPTKGDVLSGESEN